MSIQLVMVSGIGRKHGEDAGGCTYLEQFWGEISDNYVETLWQIDDCPKCGHSLKDLYSREFCPECGTDLIEACAEECAECHKPVLGDGWANLDMNGELVCANCVEEPSEDKFISMLCQHSAYRKIDEDVYLVGEGKELLTCGWQAGKRKFRSAETLGAWAYKHGYFKVETRKYNYVRNH